MQPIYTEEPFDRVATDFIKPLPATQRKNNTFLLLSFILLITPKRTLFQSKKLSVSHALIIMNKFSATKICTYCT